MPSSVESAEEPRYVALAEQFRRQIQTGELKPGDRLPSFPMMRNQYGVSQATLERVHAILQKDGLIVREQGRGTFVAEKALPVRSGILGFSGAAFSERGSFPYWGHLAEGIQSAVTTADRQLLLLNHRQSPKDVWEQIDGLLITERIDLGLLEQLPASLPCVSLLVTVPGMTAVIADDYLGARTVTRYLCSLGHRRIACLMYTDDRMTQPRYEGYLDALREAGIAPDVDWVRPPSIDAGLSITARGYVGMERWLQEGWHSLGCTALLTQNDETAIGVLRALHNAGIAVPRDLSVVGFDGTEVGEYVTPRLTTVKVPLQQIGQVGVQALIRQIETGKIEEGKIVLPTEVMFGESTASPPTSVL